MERAVLGVEPGGHGLRADNLRDAPAGQCVILVGLQLSDGYRERQRVVVYNRARAGYVPRTEPCIVGIGTRTGAGAAIGRRYGNRLDGRLLTVDGINGAGVLHDGLQRLEHKVEAAAQSRSELFAAQVGAVLENQLLERCVGHGFLQLGRGRHEVFGRSGIGQFDREGQRGGLRSRGLDSAQLNSRSSDRFGFGCRTAAVVVTVAAGSQGADSEDAHEGHFKEMCHFHTLGITTVQ